MLRYILAYRPDEFGLAPDGEGFISFKGLLQALNEEAEWRYVRHSHIREVLLGKGREWFNVQGERIRSVEMKWAADPELSSAPLPKILLAPVRRKAHAVVMEKGLTSPAGKQLLLSSDKAMAERIGMRRDRDPVLMEIMAVAAADHGVRFRPFGRLFLTREIPPRFIAGPPVPRETLESAGTARIEASSPFPPPAGALTAGTFVLDGARDPDRQRRGKGKKSKGWKEDARKMRKRK